MLHTVVVLWVGGWGGGCECVWVCVCVWGGEGILRDAPEYELISCIQDHL